MSEEGATPTFDEVYRKNFLTVYHVAHGITRNDEISEDICQEVFIRYAHHESKVRYYARYWLIRVTRNLALNVAKRRQRETQAYTRIFRESQPVTHAAEREVIQREVVDTVAAAIQKLPEKYREVIVMKEYAKLSYGDIAKVLRISEGNVKVRMYRARGKLKHILKEEHYEHEEI